MKAIDKEAYEAWVKRLTDILPARIKCPDCNGTGDGECPHCGSFIDCETCGGDKTVNPSQVISPSFYRRVMIFEEEMLEHWKKGDALATKDEKGRVIEKHNPLHELVQEFSSSSPSRLSTSSKIILRLPLTEQPGTSDARRSDV